MGCHNERVARTRKHAESKRNKSLRRKEGSSRHNSSSSSQQQARESASTSSSSARPRMGTGSHASSSNSLEPHHLPSASTAPTSATSARSVSSSSSAALPDTRDTSSWSETSPQEAPIGLKKLREREKERLAQQTQQEATPRLGGELARLESPSRPAFDIQDTGSSGDEQWRKQHRTADSSGRRSASATHSRSGSSATLGERDSSAIRKQRSFDVSSRPYSPNLSQSQPVQQRDNAAPDEPVRPATAGGPGPSSAALSISRSGSPSPSILGTSPADSRAGALSMERSSSRSEQLNAATAFSPPARSSSNDPSAVGSSSLALPKANKNANRRSGFYGIMALPQITSPGSGPGSSSLSPIKDGDSPDNRKQDDYFLVSSPSAGDTTARNLGDDAASESDANSMQPLSLAAKTMTPQRNQAQQQTKQWGTSSTLASVNTASSSDFQDSASGSASMSGSSADNHSLPASSSADSRQDGLAPPTADAKGTAGHMTFFDPDVLVFLDAVGESNDRTPAATGPGHKRTSRLMQTQPHQQGTPTRLGLDTTPQALKTTSTSPVSGTLASPCASPRLSSYQSRHLNLVADGQLPAGRQREGSPIVSPSGIGDSGGDDDMDEDEEQEHLSPLMANGASRRDSRSNYHRPHGLALSTNNAGSGRNRLTSSDTALAYNEEEDDEFSTDTLRKVRESIRRSRGGSVSRTTGDGASNGMTLDVELVELLIRELEQTKNRMKELQKNYNAIRVRCLSLSEWSDGKLTSRTTASLSSSFRRLLHGPRRV